uniref:Uncharacterized protein n=1 Tax=Mus musculus TaxID=10090 RepID=Q3V0L0_MOUSE|nr:unnamed protein product [Mus musculus]
MTSGVYRRADSLPNIWYWSLSFGTPDASSPHPCLKCVIKPWLSTLLPSLLGPFLGTLLLLSFALGLLID